MNDEELKILDSMCKSLKALHEKLSVCEDDLYRHICEKIEELELLINDGPNNNDILIDSIINKLEDINNALQKMNYRLSSKLETNPTCFGFGKSTKKHIRLLKTLSSSDQFKMQNLN